MNLAARTILLLTATVGLGFMTYAQTGTIVSGSSAGSAAELSSTCRMSISIHPFTVVAGPTAPYSGVRESSAVQTLSDGTHISHERVIEKVYRDSQGRTRTERPLCARIGDDPEALWVQIHDPVSGLGYILDSQNRIAYKYALRVRPPFQPPPAKSDRATQLSGVKVVPPSDSKRPTETEESLGTQTMEGISVDGTKRTEVIPTGAEGNDRPITIVEEVWSSADLKATILSKRSDPRMGEQTVRLTHIDTSEPSPLLFQVPPDYKVIEETDRVTLTYKRP